MLPLRDEQVPTAVQCGRARVDGPRMSEVAAFSRYVGLVVVLFAMVLVVPRMTVAAWNGLLAGVRSRWRALLA